MIAEFVLTQGTQKALEIPHYSMVRGKEKFANRLHVLKVSFLLMLAVGTGSYQLMIKSAKLLTFNNHRIDIYRNVPKKTVQNSWTGILAWGGYSG